MAEVKYPPLLKHSPYVGSASNRVIHKTDSDCSNAKMIKPDERWYLTYIPNDGNYSLCPYCFPELVEQVEEEEPQVEDAGGENPLQSMEQPVEKKRTKKASPKTKKSAAKKAAPKRTASKKTAAKKTTAKKAVKKAVKKTVKKK